MPLLDLVISRRLLHQWLLAHLHLEGITAPYIYKVYLEQIVAGEATQNIVTPVQYAAPTMTGIRVDVNRNGTPDVLQQTQFKHMDITTVTEADMNRNDIPDVLQQPHFGLAPLGFATLVLHGAPVNKGVTTVAGVDMNCDGIPDVLQQPQFVLAPQGFATTVLHGAPVNKGMTTVTGVDMNCDGIPNLLQQPQCGLATMTVTQGDLTMEEREDLLLFAMSFLRETRTLSSSTWSTN